MLTNAFAVLNARAMLGSFLSQIKTPSTGHAKNMTWFWSRKLGLLYSANEGSVKSLLPPASLAMSSVTGAFLSVGMVPSQPGRVLGCATTREKHEKARASFAELSRSGCSITACCRLQAAGCSLHGPVFSYDLRYRFPKVPKRCPWKPSLCI